MYKVERIYKEREGKVSEGEGLWKITEKRGIEGSK